MQNKSTQEFDDIIRNIIENQKVQEMKKYKQHYETSTFDHCYMVSYYCYKVCKKLKLDYKSAARAGMLHDFFLYDWRIKNGRKGLHAFTHGKTACKNASELFELSEKEIKRTAGNERVNRLSHYYYDRYTSDLHFFKDECNCNLIEKFKYFQDIGVLEIITCGATHGYFPILYVTEETVRAQIAVGVQTYERYFGRKPRGIWLPECGYVPEADKYLREFGIEYAIVESHGFLISV